ncbi:MAG: GNAT family N-acetyltransferase [Clostridia bacterium]|nr:GNAT family N-acetyltransferase [Clostridia bacterium]
MIRFYNENDRENLIFLWNEAFGDEREAIEFFLDNRCIPQNTVVYEKNGKIASMLFLLEGKLLHKSVNYNAYYLYAAATLKKFRGRGIMKEMLDYAAKLSLERKIDFICLKPAEKNLYKYYDSNGYKTIFRSKTVFFSAKETDNIRITYDNESDRFIWDSFAAEYATAQHKFYGGKAIINRNGQCLYSIEDDVCSVKDINFTGCAIVDFIKEIYRTETFKQFKITLPFSTGINVDNCFVDDSGMALAITERADDVISEINNAYLNLTLD